MATIDEIDTFAFELISLYPSAKNMNRDQVSANFEKYLSDIPAGILEKSILEIMDASPEFFPTIPKIREVAKKVYARADSTPTNEFAEPNPLQGYWLAMQAFNDNLAGELSDEQLRRHDKWLNQLQKSDFAEVPDAA